jgi:cysteinyl-tRNA synthetase
VDLRSDSRAAGDWAASDRLRDVLAGVGVEVRDSREGSTWQWM